MDGVLQPRASAAASRRVPPRSAGRRRGRHRQSSPSASELRVPGWIVHPLRPGEPVLRSDGGTENARGVHRPSRVLRREDDCGGIADGDAGGLRAPSTDDSRGTRRLPGGALRGERLAEWGRAPSKLDDDAEKGVTLTACGSRNSGPPSSSGQEGWFVGRLARIYNLLFLFL